MFRLPNARLFVLFLVLAGAVVFASACSSNKPRSAQPDKTTDSLLGVDINDDGVRDDIERLIDERYPDSARTRASLEQAARVMQAKLRAADDVGALRQVLIDGFRAVECVRVVRGAVAYDDLNWLHENFYNTRDRVFRYIEAQNTAPGVGYEVKATPSPDACDLDLSSVPN